MNDAQEGNSKSPRLILATPRLLLRVTIDPDIGVLQQRIFRDPAVMRHVFGGSPMDDDRSEDFIRKFFTFSDVIGIAVLCERPANETVGFAGLFDCKALGENDLEIGFVMARQAWGREYATEIGDAQLAFGFSVLKRERLLGLVHPDNAASIHALKKLGMHYLRDVKEGDRPLRSVYAISASEWRRR